MSFQEEVGKEPSLRKLMSNRRSPKTSDGSPLSVERFGASE